MAVRRSEARLLDDHAPGGTKFGVMGKLVDAEAMIYLLRHLLTSWLACLGCAP